MTAAKHGENLLFPRAKLSKSKEEELDEEFIDLGEPMEEAQEDESAQSGEPEEEIPSDNWFAVDGPSGPQEHVPAPRSDQYGKGTRDRIQGAKMRTVARRAIVLWNLAKLRYAFNTVQEYGEKLAQMKTVGKNAILKMQQAQVAKSARTWREIVAQVRRDKFIAGKAAKVFENGLLSKRNFLFYYWQDDCREQNEALDLLREMAKTWSLAFVRKWFGHWLNIHDNGGADAAAAGQAEKAREMFGMQRSWAAFSVWYEKYIALKEQERRLRRGCMYMLAGKLAGMVGWWRQYTRKKLEMQEAALKRQAAADIMAEMARQRRAEQAAKKDGAPFKSALPNGVQWQWRDTTDLIAWRPFGIQVAEKVDAAENKGDPKTTVTLVKMDAYKDAEMGAGPHHRCVFFPSKRTMTNINTQRNYEIRRVQYGKILRWGDKPEEGN